MGLRVAAIWTVTHAHCAPRRRAAHAPPALTTTPLAAALTLPTTGAISSIHDIDLL